MAKRRITIIWLLAPLAVAACTGSFLPNLSPTSSFTYQLAGQFAPTTVDLNGSGSSDRDGTIASYTWKINGVTTEPSTPTVTGLMLPSAGSYTISLTVTDDRDASNTSSQTFNLCEPPTVHGAGQVGVTSPDVDQPSPDVLASLGCDGDPVSGFNIEMLYGGPGFTPARKQVFEDAATRWAEVILNDLPDTEVTQEQVNLCLDGFAFSGTVDGVLILATIEPIDGQSNTLGYAGTCFFGSDGHTLMGLLTLDSADVEWMEEESDDYLLDVVLHEIGHILEIGGRWEFRGLLSFTGGSCLASPTPPEYVGAKAVAQWQLLGGAGYVPVEEDDGSGTACAHWDEETFDGELMTGYISGARELSRVTIGSLDDLNYQVNYAAADPYSLPTSLRVATAATSSAREVLVAPIGIIHPDGTTEFFAPEPDLELELRFELHGQ